MPGLSAIDEIIRRSKTPNDFNEYRVTAVASLRALRDSQVSLDRGSWRSFCGDKMVPYAAARSSNNDSHAGRTHDRAISSVFGEVPRLYGPRRFRRCLPQKAAPRHCGSVLGPRCVFFPVLLWAASFRRCSVRKADLSAEKWPRWRCCTHAVTLWPPFCQTWPRAWSHGPWERASLRRAGRGDGDARQLTNDRDRVVYSGGKGGRAISISNVSWFFHV